MTVLEVALFRAIPRTHGTSPRDPSSPPRAVVFNLVEALGGLSPPGAARLWKVARRTQVRGARDGTSYGRLRISTKSFVSHHVQRMSRAAVYNDARNICEQVAAQKQKALQHGPRTTPPP